MMTHRKAHHKSFVRTCTNSLKNNCRFESNACWFSHEEEEMETNDNEMGKTANDDDDKVSEIVKQFK
jgi:hypothetical protein